MSKEYVPITEDDFYNKYKPTINHIERAKYPKNIEDVDVCSFGGTMYETYGEELEFILSLANGGKLKHVWTIVDGDNGEMIIQTGYWRVNRIGYIVTENPWEDEGVHVEQDWEVEPDDDEPFEN
jgi:hypothetical protein